MQNRQARFPFKILLTITLCLLPLTFWGCLGNQINPSEPIICTQPDNPDEVIIDPCDFQQQMLVGGYWQLPGVERRDGSNGVTGCVIKFSMINNSSNCCPTLEGIERYPGLKHLELLNLNVSPAGSITELDFTPVASLQNLERVDILKAQHLQTLDLTPLSACSNLKYLLITNTSSSDGFREIILPQSDSLEELFILNNDELTTIEMSSCPNLRRLEIIGNPKLNMPVLDLADIGPLPNLESFVFVESDVKAIEIIDMPSLEKFIVKNHEPVTEFDLSPLSGSTVIDEVEIGYMDIPELDIMTPLDGKIHLKSLALKGMPLPDESILDPLLPPSIPIFVTEIPDLDSLQILVLEQLGIEDVEIPDLEELLTLSLSGLPNTYEIDFSDNLFSLLTLTISNVYHIPELDIPQLPKLETFSISGLGFLGSLTLDETLPSLKSFTISTMTSPELNPPGDIPLIDIIPDGSLFTSLDIEGLGASRQLESFTLINCPLLSDFQWPDHIPVENLQYVTIQECYLLTVPDGGLILSNFTNIIENLFASLTDPTKLLNITDPMQYNTIQEFVNYIAATSQNLRTVDLSGNWLFDFDMRPLLFQPYLEEVNLGCNFFFLIDTNDFTVFCPDEAADWPDWNSEFFEEFGYIPGQLPYDVTNALEDDIYDWHKLTINYEGNPVIQPLCFFISTVMSEAACDTSSLEVKMGPCLFNYSSSRTVISIACPLALPPLPFEPAEGPPPPDFREERYY